MSLRSTMLRIASELPKGDPTRKEILAAVSASDHREAAAEKMLYTVTINVPKDSARDVQKALDAALDKAIKGMKGMEGHKGVSSRLRD